MAHDTVRDDDAARTERRRAAVVGALAGAGAMVTVMAFFYPLGRLVDPTMRDNGGAGLLAEVVLGGVAGVVMSPIAAAIGAIVGRWLGGRRIGARLAVIVTVVATAAGIALLLALNGGRLVDERSTYGPLRHVVVLGVLAAAVGIALHEVAHRVLLGGGLRRRPATG